MPRRTVVATRHSTGDLEAVWTLLSQAHRWKEWGRFTLADLEREGDPAPDGVGAIRRLGFAGRAGSREEIVAFEPPTHLGYTLLSGLPLRDYRADVTLTPADGGGTDIEWRSSYRPPWPGSGPFWDAVLRLLLADFTRGLARAAARPA